MGSNPTLSATNIVCVFNPEKMTKVLKIDRGLYEVDDGTKSYCYIGRNMDWKELRPLESNHMKIVNLILMGYGNVGKAFFRLVQEKKEVCRNKYNLDFRFPYIFEVEGALYSAQGLTSEDVPEISASELRKNPLWKNAFPLEQALKNEAPGVFVECTPSSIKTGEPGLAHIKNAMKNGWHVATANKGPLVADYAGLRMTSREIGVSLKCSGATAAALPTLDVGLISLAGTEISSIEGILNGTTNYILTEMREGVRYAEALKEAQDKGIAERDPSLDVEGWDTAAKLLIISNAVLGTDFRLDDIKVEGITHISSESLLQAKRENKKIKLLGSIRRDKESIRARVAPATLDENHPLYGIDGTNKGISFFTDTMGAVTVTGGKSDPKGAAAALLKDIINIFMQIFFLKNTNNT